jgi:hypothetical protein
VQLRVVMRGLDPRIHVVAGAARPVGRTWMAGTSPAMTTFGWLQSRRNNLLPFPGQHCLAKAGIQGQCSKYRPGLPLARE